MTKRQYIQRLAGLRTEAQEKANKAYEDRDAREAYSWKEVARLMDAAVYLLRTRSKGD